MKKIKGKNGKFLTAMLLLGLVFCFQTNAKAETMDPPTEEDVYVHERYLNEDGFGAEFNRAVVIDKVVYQYMPEKDSYRIVTFDDNEGYFPDGKIFKPRSEVRGKPVTEIVIDSEDGQDFGRISLVLPESIQKIDLWDIYLTSITLPASIKTENISIADCGVIDRIYFPKTAVAVGGLYEVVNVTELELPSTVKKIEKNFMKNSSDLQAVYIPQGVKTIEQGAFAGCGNLEVYVPSSVKKIGKKAFGKDNNAEHVKMLYCEKNSAAYRYAKKNHIPYKIVKGGKASRKAKSISLAEKKITMKAGDKKAIRYWVTPVYASNRKVKFKSSNPEIVSVNAKGILTANKKGKATIQVQLKSGSKKKVQLTVNVKKRKRNE